MLLELPDKLFDNECTIEDIRLDLAISLFQREKVSLGKAAQIAGMNRWEFQKVLTERRIPVINYSPEDLKKEIETLRRLLP